MAEETEEKVEESTEETHKTSTEEQEREPSKKEYVCNLCGATVVPEEHETERGKRYRCPECGKFMKPLTPEEAKERKEEEKGPLPPPEVILTERVKELLTMELPRIYGIPKKDMSKTITAIIDTLTPEQATEKWNLHSHIKDFASNANDRHLESIINKIFYQLEEEGYLPREQYQPRYDRRRPPRGGYQPRYGPQGIGSRRVYLPDENYYVEEQDYEPRRRGSRMKVVVDGQEIETDYEGYMAYQRYKREEAEEGRRQQEHELRMKRLEAEITKITKEAEEAGSKSGSSETLIPVKIGEKEINVPASVAHLYLKPDDKELKDTQDKLEKERDERHKAEMKRLEEKIENQPTFLEQLEYYERAGQRLGLRQTGRTTMDVLDSLRGDLQTTAQQILNKLPTPGGEFKPEVTRTPEERRMEAERIKKRLSKSEEILSAEDELLKAASKVGS